ncbi:hypothetical protein PF008_g16833 [Phytophthora fragariae]|uniref:Uncharacterized protein n=1 Tax=Phytophthora fragariae TaxID=53985 RepID=A0A6G0R9Z6_9STRA|nr:hypothetical protein PF008_g16833 [Phytophthora fragariae]
MIGAASPVLMWCCTFTFANGGHPSFFSIISAYWRNSAMNRYLSFGSMSPICKLASLVSGAASSIRNVETHFATLALSSSPFTSKIFIVSSVGTHVPKAALAGNFSRLPSIFRTATRTMPSCTVSSVGAINKWRLLLAFGTKMPVVSSAASTVTRTTLCVLVASLIVLASRTVACRCSPACCKVVTP